MFYIAIRYDKPGANVFRELLKEEHRAFLRSLGPKLLTAGAIFDEVGEVIGGSITFEADSIEAASRIASSDPYSQHSEIELNRLLFPFRVRWKDGIYYSGEGYAKGGQTIPRLVAD
jgi:uncharacterized protein YciI